MGNFIKENDTNQNHFYGRNNTFPFPARHTMRLSLRFHVGKVISSRRQLEVWLTLLKFSHKTSSGTKITYVGSGNDRWRLPVSWMKVLCASPSTQTPDPRPSLHFPLHLLKTPQTDAFTVKVHWNRVRLSLPPKANLSARMWRRRPVTHRQFLTSWERERADQNQASVPTCNCFGWKITFLIGCIQLLRPEILKFSSCIRAYRLKGQWKTPCFSKPVVLTLWMHDLDNSGCTPSISLY